MPAKPPVIAICVPIARELHPDFAFSLMQWTGSISASAPRPRIVEMRGHPVDYARNKIVEQACAIEEVTHLMWIDDDMAFEPDAIPRLLAHDLPIVGGLCFGRRHPYPPILLYKPRETLGEGGTYRYRYDYPEGLVEVDATGFAFILVRKEVFEKIDEELKEPIFAERAQGEDTSACERIRQVGYKIMVDTSIKIRHMNGTIAIDEAFAKRNRDIEINAWYPVVKSESGDGKPVATIIIPTWNQKPEWLRQAVESALAQTVPVEVIVVDDGSDAEHDAHDVLLDPHYAEHTSAVFRDARADGRLCIVRIPHAGCFAALNAGIRAMSTEWFSWLSSDDVFHPAKIERQLRAMLATESKASFHGYINIAENGAQSPVIPGRFRSLLEQQMILSQACPINGLTVMIHRSVLEEIRLPNGDFFDRETSPIVADWRAWNAIGQKHLWLGMQDMLATRRDFDNASTRYQADPEKRAQWIAEDEAVRRDYAPRCPDCQRTISIGRAP